MDISRVLKNIFVFVFIANFGVACALRCWVGDKGGPYHETDCDGSCATINDKECGCWRDRMDDGCVYVAPFFLKVCACNGDLCNTPPDLPDILL